MIKINFFTVFDHVTPFCFMAILSQNKAIMETTITTSVNWSTERAHPKQKISIYDRWLEFEDSQAKNKTFWYYVSMIVQGVFFLPLPAVLIFYFNAPTLILIPTLVMFFSNIIAGMSGAGIRAILSLYVISVLVHAVMFTIYMI